MSYILTVMLFTSIGFLFIAKLRKKTVSFAYKIFTYVIRKQQTFSRFLSPKVSLESRAQHSSPLNKYRIILCITMSNDSRQHMLHVPYFSFGNILNKRMLFDSTLNAHHKNLTQKYDRYSSLFIVGIIWQSINTSNRHVYPFWQNLYHENPRDGLVCSTQQNKNEFLTPNVQQSFETKRQCISVAKWKRNWKVLLVSHFIITNHFILFVYNMNAKCTHHILFIMLAFDIIYLAWLCARNILKLQLPTGRSTLNVENISENSLSWIEVEGMQCAAGCDVLWQNYYYCEHNSRFVIIKICA